MTRRPVRVLQVLQTLETGGAERLQVCLAKSVDPDEVDLQVCCLGADKGSTVASDLRTESVKTWFLGAPRLRDPSALPRLARLLRSQRIDVVHTHLSTPTILGVSGARLTRVPAVCTVHNQLSFDDGRSRLNGRLEVTALRRADHVIAVSAPIADDLRHRVGIADSELSVIDNCVDPAFFAEHESERVASLRSELLDGLSGPLIVTVGAVSYRKAQHLLVAAMTHVLPSFPEARLAIVGRPHNNAERVAAEIRDRGLQSHVTCTGERSDVPLLLHAADVFAMSSVTEGMPLAVLEAMAVGVPVVAPDVGGMRSAVDDGVTGRLVAGADARALAEGITGLLERPRLMRSLAEAAFGQVTLRHGAKEWARRLTMLYAAMADGAPTSSAGADLSPKP